MTIEVSRSPYVSWITINRKDKANSLDYAHMKDMTLFVSKECLNSSTSSVAIIGAGSKYFSAGIDLIDVFNVRDVDESIKIVVDAIGSLLKEMLRCKKPIIVALNGSVYGLAVELVQVADLVYAVKGVKVAVPALRFGLIPPYSSLTLNKIVTEMILTGTVLDAERLVSLGIINSLTENIDELRQRVEEVSMKIKNFDLSMISLIKETRFSIFWPKIQEGLLLMSLSLAREETRSRIKKFFIERKE